MFSRRIALCALLSLPAPAVAEVRALLVGVSDYLTLDADLKGPSADVRLMAEVLAGQGVAPGQMRALVSDPAGLDPAIATGVPRRDQILAAMDAVAASAQPGDTVIFYFSGHGAEAPDDSGDEGGGYDEILLPADAMGWTGATQKVGNALLDDELQDWARGLTGRGVKLVGLIDACHSDTGFRAVGGQGVARGLSPEALGVPADAAPAPAGDPTPPLPGEFVFLYSSQSDQRSFEYPLADGSEWHGEFTLRLTQSLRAAPGAPWAQVLAATSDAMVQGAARQVPAGEGPLLQAPAFAGGAAARRWPVAQGVVQAGLLAGLNPGDGLAFYAAPVGGEALAEARLAKVDARQARPDTPPPAAALWAEVTTPAAPALPVLGMPVRADAADGLDYGAWLAVLPATPPATAPDLIPILTGGTVALAGADGALDPAGPGSTPRLVIEPGETPAQAMDRVMQAAGHGLRLRALLAGLSGRSLTGSASLQVETQFRAGKVEGEDCTAAPGAAWAPHDPARPLQPCDALRLRITNVSGKTIDLSVLYFAADFSVTPIWPSRGLSNRLAPGEATVAALAITPGSGFAAEELLFAAVPVDPDGDRVDLTRLAAPEMSRGFADGDGPAELWLMRQLDPVLEDTSRGFSARPPAVMITRQEVRLAPATKED